MIKFELLVCAETLLKQSDNDSYSAINIFEDLLVEAYPTIIQKLAVLLVISREEQDEKSIEINFEIKNNEELIFSNRMPVNFFDKLKANLALKVDTVPVNNQGKLTFKFYKDGASIIYSINIKTRPKVTDVS